MRLGRVAATAVLAALVLAVLAAGGFAGVAPSARSAACGFTTSGHHWLVAPRGLSCTQAKAVVATLAAKKVPASGRWPGTYGGMQCISTSKPGGKPEFIGCGSANHSRTIQAFRV